MRTHFPTDVFFRASAAKTDVVWLENILVPLFQMWSLKSTGHVFYRAQRYPKRHIGAPTSRIMVARHSTRWSNPPMRPCSITMSVLADEDTTSVDDSPQKSEQPHRWIFQHGVPGSQAEDPRSWGYSRPTTEVLAPSWLHSIFKQPGATRSRNSEYLHPNFGRRSFRWDVAVTTSSS